RHEPREQWWRQLQKQLREVKPTVVILGYGMASSFAGENGLPQFVADMKRLIDTIQEIDKTTPVRFVFVGPIPHFGVSSSPASPQVTGVPDHNQDLSRYSKALHDLAAEREA